MVVEQSQSVDPFRSDCLAGKRIFISGASSGIGRAAALGLAERGAVLHITGRDGGRLSDTYEQLPGDGHVATAAALDDADVATELMRAAARDFGGLDGVFHAAGVSVTLPLKLLKQTRIQETFQSSAFAAYGIMRAAALRDVMAAGSSIIVMSSVTAVRGHAGMATYAGAKAAVEGLVRSAALELAARGIRCNAIACGAVYTEMYAREVDRMGDDWIAGIRNRHPLGFGHVDDVTNAVTYLLSDASRWMTGTAMTLDGGFLAG